MTTTNYLPDDFFDKLRDIYEAKANTKSYWAHENVPLRDIFAQVGESLKFNYEIVAPFRVGGSGVVAFVRDKNLDVTRVLKVSRPSPGKEDILAKILSAETKTLLRLSHQNIIRIFAQGVARHAGEPRPYYVMDYIEGALDSDEYLEKSPRTLAEFLRILVGMVSAIEYLHAHDQIHMDLKPQNLLVTPNGTPILSDLGFAKHLRIDDKYTFIGGTKGFIHPDAYAFLLSVESDPNRLMGDAPHSSLKKEWDLYSLGKTVLRLTEAMVKASPSALDHYHRRYLRLLGCRLLDGHNEAGDTAANVTLSTFKEIKYASVTEARDDLLKLTGEYNLEASVPELQRNPEKTVQLATGVRTPFTPRVRSIVRTPHFRGLGSVTQLGLLNLIYPTTMHTRMEHALGTFSVLCRYIIALHNDPLNPVFRQLINAYDIRCALLAGLLHDIGQYPMAHDLEEADKTVFDHESHGLRLLKTEKNAVSRVAESEWGVKFDDVLRILEARPRTVEGTPLRGTLKHRILHTLIDGPIDCDKVDYIVRDSLHLGLTYGRIIDLERLLACLSIVLKPQEKDETYGALGIHEKGKVQAEAVAFARYALYGQVYWHHAYRAIKAMLHRAVWEMQEHGKASKEALREQFFEEIDAHVLGTAGTPTLFPLESALWGAGGEVQIRDLATVNWIGKHSSPAGRELVEAMARRDLFKRVLVLSHASSEDSELWDELTEFFDKHRRDPFPRLSFQRQYQEKVRKDVEEMGPLPAQSEVLTLNAKTSFLGACARGIVLLVDVPPERRASRIDLEYLVEEDRRRYRVEEMPVASLERSQVWKQLETNFRRSIGKIRVFCHPDHREFLNAAQSREQLRDALETALSRATVAPPAKE